MCYWTVSDTNCIKDVDLAKYELMDRKSEISLHQSLTQKSLESSGIP